MENNICLKLDRSYINRYKHDLKYDKIYVDLDDTLIINNKVNVELIKFLYQCINNNYKIILLTKTENNLNLSLNKHKLNGLFDEIHVIDKNDCKSNYIDPKNSIFIDDSFNERIEVFNKLNIPTFDCSMIESLLDDRC
jgi:FMN phosphatase YigB (HAD superfamily)